MRGVVSLTIMLDGAPRRRWRSFLRCVPAGTRPAHQPRNCFGPLRRDHTVQSERMELAPGLIIADPRDATGPGGRPREMRRQDRRGIAHGLINLGLGQVARLKQARAREISAGELGAGKIGAVKKRFAEVGAREIDAVKSRIAQVCVPQICCAEVGACQRGKAQRGVPQPRRGEIDGSAVDWTHLPLADVQGKAAQVRNDLGILRAPCVPRPWAAAQNFDMAGVLRQGFHVTGNAKRIAT